MDNHFHSTVPPEQPAVDAMFRLMVEEIEETAIFLMDPDGHITLWNKAAERMKGYTAEEALGRHFGMLYTEEEQARGEPAINLARAERDGSFQTEGWRRRKDGSLFWARLTLTALRDAGPSLLGFAKVTLDLTRHKLLEQCEREKEEVQRVLEATSAGTWQWNPVDDDLRVSSHLSSLLQYPHRSLPLRLHQWIELVHPAERVAVARLFTPTAHACSEPAVLEARVRSGNGQYRWMYLRGAWLHSGDAQPQVLRGVAVDIDELKAAREDFRVAQLGRAKEEQRARTTLQSITDGVITTDAAGIIDRMNPAAERLTGWALGEALGHHVREVYHVLPNPRAALPASQVDPVSTCLRENRPVSSDDSATLANKQGRTFAVRHSAAPLVGDGGAQEGVVLVVHDNTESKDLLDSLSYQASHDALTGLINRREFNVRLERTLAAVKRDPRSSSALLFLDLDYFKIVNDSCGHEAGDALLRELSAAYASHLRERDTLARIGGDEFALIVERCSLDEAMAVANKLLDTTRQFRHECAGQVFNIGVSIGMFLIDEQVACIEDAMRMADHACYIAKESGRNRIFVQRRGDAEVVQRRSEMLMAGRLSEAHIDEYLQLHYQVIHPLHDKSKGVHYEMLLRMRGSGKVLLPPSKFLPAADRYDLMPNIDRWVLRRSVQWLASNARHIKDLQMCSINVSQRAVADPAFTEFASRLLAESAVPNQKLCFEISESGATANLNRTLSFIGAMKLHGCRLALDDFGTGLASPAYLKQLPVDLVKIDGSFVRGMTSNRVDFEMVRFANEISHAMGRETVAEYVTSSSTLALLRDMGVDFAQGYLLGKPRALA